MYLQLKNTSIGYKTPLIKDIDSSLSLGDICLLIGNNGAGKTTLIKSILHQTATLKGNIFIDGKDIKTLTLKEIAEKVAIVFSKSLPANNYTLFDLIAFGKYLHYPYYFSLNETDIKEIEDIIECLNLTQYRNFKLHELSDGNLQKAFIGRALAQNSPIIILDEPTTHLDEENKIIILKILRNLAKEQNKLILFSSHDWRLAKEFSDKIWLLNDKKLDSGIAEEILLRHHEVLNPQLFNFANDFVAPVITAPDLEKEMVYSFLQKNFNKDLSSYKFHYQEHLWEISIDLLVVKCNSFDEIGKFLSNPYQ